MSLDEYLENIDQFINELEKELPEIMLEASINAKTEIQERIQEQGLNDNGTPLKFGSGTPYSEKDVPAFFYANKANNSGGRRAIENAQKDGEGLSYKDWRKANGLQTDHVDLTFTGRMWQNIGVKSVNRLGSKVTVTIAGRNQETQDKLNRNSQMYGDILSLNKDEKENLNLIIDKRINQLATKFL